jgi:uncharacterized protein YbjT (DUF2867 family)
MILITGASGYVGNNLVRRLVEVGQPVRALVRDRAKAGARLSDLHDRIEIAVGDVTRPETLAPALDGVTAVVHLVAVAIEHGAQTYERVNVQGTANVVDAMKVAGVRRLIHMGQNGSNSALPYPFMASKGVAQDVVMASGLDWTVLRPSVIWGPQDEFANVQARLIKLSPLIFPIVGDGRARFQPVWVGDVVEAAVFCLDDDQTTGQVYALGGPEVLTYAEIVARVLKALKARRLTFNVPVPLLRPVVKLMEVALPNPPVTTSLLSVLKVDNTTPDNALPTVFHITPRPFVPENLAYMRQFSALGSLKRLMGQRTADEVRS